jgi:hypothetical protein
MKNVLIGPFAIGSEGYKISTVNPAAPYCVNLPLSKNLQGGAQFTYSFWLNTNGSVDDLSNQIILLRGLPNQSNFITKLGATPGYIDEPIEDASIKAVKMTVDGNPDLTYTESVKVNTDVFIKCPLIRFDANPRILKVAFNTTASPNNEVIFDLTSLPGFGTKQWTMFCVCMEDNRDNKSQENGVVIRLYIDGKLLNSRRMLNSALKINNGPVYVIPINDNAVTTRREVTSKISYVRYYDKSLSDVEVNAEYLDQLKTQIVGLADRAPCVTGPP